MPSIPPRGPSLRGLDPWTLENPSHGKTHQLLSAEERARLAVIASLVRFKKGAEIYREGGTADAVYNLISGVVKGCQKSPRSEFVVAFLFPEDVFGLAEKGHYVNSAKAITPVTAYRIPISALRRQLSNDTELEFQVITKLCNELRQAQRHAFLLSNRHILSKLALFLQMLEQLEAANGEPTNTIYLPMDRSDIADYVGTTLAALSRGFRTLRERGIVQFPNRRHAKIVDRVAFEALIDRAK